MHHHCQLEDFQQETPEMDRCAVCGKRIPAFTLDEYRPFLNPDYATAWECADDCDTCWYFMTDTALDELGDDVIAAKLRAHLASGHTLTSEEC